MIGVKKLETHSLNLYQPVFKIQRQENINKRLYDLIKNQKIVLFRHRFFFL